MSNFESYTSLKLPPLNSLAVESSDPIQGLQTTSHPYVQKRKPPSSFLHKSPAIKNLTVQLLQSRLYRQQNNQRRDSKSGVDSRPNNAIPSPLSKALLARVQSDIPPWLIDPTPPWGVSSVADLEALDSILDQLAVQDPQMRTALLKGPLISFETIVPPDAPMQAMFKHYSEPSALPVPPEQKEDYTFLTGVKDDFGGPGSAVSDAEAMVPENSVPQTPEKGTSQHGVPDSSYSTIATAVAAVQEVSWAKYVDATGPTRTEAPGRLPEAMRSGPTFGMHPNLVRSYLTMKVNQKQPITPAPLPAPTADYLVKTRPPPFIEAPSYDQLSRQIKDVQRQYTCGTMHGQQTAGTLNLPSMATNSYISGLDGPLLEDAVRISEEPTALERTRPKFVSMRKSKSARPGERSGSPSRMASAKARSPSPRMALM